MQKKNFRTSRFFSWGLCLLVGGMIVSCTGGVKSAQQADPGESMTVQPAVAGGARISTAASSLQHQILAGPERRGTDNRAGGPLTNVEGKHFVGSSRCAACHDLLVDKAGNDMSISNHWRSTMMANAAKDPLWLAKVSSEVSRNPALKEVIEEKCSLCHMPMAWTEANVSGQGKSMFEYGFLDVKSEKHELAMDGVSCSLCHQAQDKNMGAKKSFSGKFTIDTDTPVPDRKIFGPYRETYKKTMQTSVGFTPVFGAHTNDSALCATCHTLYTPYVDAAGNVVGEFPEQTAYLEWKHSNYAVPDGVRYDIGENPGQGGKICQECHMPHSEEGGVFIAKWTPPQAKQKDHFSQHHFVGGNVFMLNIFQDNLASLGITASTDQLEDTKKRTLKLLQKESASLSIVNPRVSGGELYVLARIDNIVGHKFPTGFPSRNTWIHMKVLDGQGQVVFDSGAPRADGSIAGNNADEKSGEYEPHYDIVTDPGQVQIYETIMGNTDGNVTYTLLRAASYLKDNRLLPPGFDKKTASPDIAVYGKAKDDPNFVGGSDQVLYRVNVKGGRGPYTVQAELLYTPVSYNFMRDLNKDSALPLVNRFAGYYDKADKAPVVVAAVQQVVR